MNIDKDQEAKLIKHHTDLGWICDKNDEKTLGFSKDGWIRDYDKKDGSFIHFDGNQEINIMVK